MTISPDQLAIFRTTVWDYYNAHKRPMPWRQNPTPYFVMVSEIMLQQTQVPRVLVKFAEFIQRFPDVKTLAGAPLGDVLVVWSGLGYNRRAKFLWEAAKAVAGQGMPKTQKDLVALPGIGPNTAGAIMAYAYNQPVVFIETNIRTVIIHHFFANQEAAVKDAQIATVLQQALPADNPREWYWALMDYGTHLKATTGNHLHKVHNYKKQSKFEGSRRQVRGKVLKLLIDGPHTTSELSHIIADGRLPEVMQDLAKEGLIRHTKTTWHLTA